MKDSGANKLKTLSQLAKISDLLKKKSKKIVLCHGVFDLIHPGHIKHLASAKKYGNILVVSVTADDFVRKGPGRPFFRESLRAEFLASIMLVDYVVINRDYSAIPVILKIKPDYYIKGPDYKKRNKFQTIPSRLSEEEEAVKSGGGKMVFTDDEIFSSSRLLNDFLEDYSVPAKKYLNLFKNKYRSEEIVEELMTLKNLKILVVGDAIIDQYHYCTPMGRSSKEPIIVHKHVSEESFIGGALATANHLCALSKNIHLLTVLGKKQSKEFFIRKKLNPAVKTAFYTRNDVETTVKRRYIDVGTKQKLFQISFIRDDFIPPAVEEKILSFLKKTLSGYDLVVVNDFGHGLLTAKMIRIISRYAKYIALNVQTNSANYGFNVVTKYPRADYVCIDEQELRLASHDKYSPLETIIRKIYKKMKCREMLITRGLEGSMSYSTDEGYILTPALTTKVIDRVGAGDALFAISAPCEYKGMKSDVVSFLGNVAGALQVQTMGNSKAIELIDMVKFITRLLK